MDKPQNIKEFEEWYNKTFPNNKIDSTKKTYYEQVSRSMKQQIETSNFWSGFLESFENLCAEYLLNTQYEFIIPPAKMPELYIKPFESYEEKIFHKNVIDNKEWPDPPKDGWYMIDTSFQRIKDVIRTSFTVKYLDGVELLADKLSRYAEVCSNETKLTLEAREQGYYAAHLDIIIPVEIPLISWDTQKIHCSFEIQITTQLQEVLKKLTHQYYEDRRVRVEEVNHGPTKKWQWDYKSEEFAANYLGHILHYLEGMILEIRDRRAKQ